MLDVVYVGPLPRELPPVGAANQWIVPADAVAVSNTGPGPQRLPTEVPVITGLTMVMSAPLSLPVTEGLPEMTLIR